MNLRGREFIKGLYVYEIEGEEWFIGKDILEVLGYIFSSKPLQQRVNSEYKKTLYIETINNRSVNNNRTLINKKGLLDLISKSQKLSSIEKQEWLTLLNVEYVVTSRQEIEFGKLLQEALSEINIEVIPQYRVDNYKIDFYLPKFNIAIEYDEQQHFTPTNEKKDSERQLYIENKLGCKFIRCDYRYSDIRNIMKVIKLCNEEYPNKILNIELFKKLIIDYCSNTYIDEIEIISDDNDFIHIKSFGYNYIISKTKNLKKIIGKAKNLQKLSTACLIIPQEKCSTNYLTRIIVHGLELEYDGKMKHGVESIPILKVVDNASISYFYYKKEGYYGDGVDFKVDLDTITIDNLNKLEDLNGDN